MGDLPEWWLRNGVSGIAAALSALVVVLLWYRKFPPRSLPNKNPVLRSTLTYFFASLAVLALLFILKTIIRQSDATLGFHPIFSTGKAGLLTVLQVAVWLQVLFVVVHRLLMEVESSGLRSISRMKSLLLGIGAALPVAFWVLPELSLVSIGLILLGFLGLFDLFLERRSLNLTWLAVWMAVLSAGATYGMSSFGKLKVRQEYYFTEAVLSDPHPPKAVGAFRQLARYISDKDTLLTLLSTPVPFTVQEEVLRREIAPLLERLPHLKEHYRLESILAGNPRLKQSVVEGRSYQQIQAYLDQLHTDLIPTSDADGYGVLLPIQVALSGNKAALWWRPRTPLVPDTLSIVSLFSGIFILLTALTALWAALAFRLRFLFGHQEFSFIDKPSLRNRIQLWLAAFTLGAFVLTGLVSYTFFQRFGIIEPSTMHYYLSALLNLYVFLLLAALAVAVAVGNSITKPLAVIGDKLQRLKLGNNEPLEWSGQDEIGQLVSAYNRMIEEVERSAELLRRSEREGAWREMARQVAHEIKNPLTPMKLSIQYLQRAYQNDPEQALPLINSVAGTLIEQIDTLTKIAGEFSNFAQMPRQEKEVFDAAELVRSISRLFELEQTEGKVQIICTTPDIEIPVFADRSQLTRVINNLIKNAIQAIPEERAGKVLIVLEEQSSRVLLSVRDNGSGIAPDLQTKVFYPNFTTKSSGMGLGLAMCKNIVDASEGRIWFETAENAGTTFFVELPAAQA